MSAQSITLHLQYPRNSREAYDYVETRLGNLIPGIERKLLSNNRDVPQKLVQWDRRQYPEPTQSDDFVDIYLTCHSETWTDKVMAAAIEVLTSGPWCRVDVGQPKAREFHFVYTLKCKLQNNGGFNTEMLQNLIAEVAQEISKLTALSAEVRSHNQQSTGVELYECWIKTRDTNAR